jgi:hypothetical protein
MQLRLSQSLISLIALATLACNAAPIASQVFSIEVGNVEHMLDKASYISVDS